jgi:hypothetical protein
MTQSVNPVLATCPNTTQSNIFVANGNTYTGTLVNNLNDGWSVSNRNNNLVIGTETGSGTTEVYVVEEWQSKKPIEVGNGLYVSFEEDLITADEIQELVYAKIEETYPEKAIKLGMDKNNLTIRKLSLPIEIKMKES